MKKILSIILCSVLLISCLAGCDAQQEGQTDELLVGYGRASIVPEFFMPLQGYSGSENRWFNNVLDPVYVTALAFTDKTGNTAILMQYDLGKCNNVGVGKAMNEIAKTYGIDRLNIFASATHTHSAPSIASFGYDDTMPNKYAKYLQTQTMAAVKEAMESRLPAEIYAGSTDTVGLNFIRHYYMDDGSIVGDNFGDPNGKQFARHTQNVDPELQLLRFKREGGKDVVVANFQCHPLRTGGAMKLDLSSDFIGPMTTYVEDKLDCHFAYFTGASGNIDPTSRITSENITGDHVEQGEALGKYAVLVYSNMEKLDSGAVCTGQKICTVEGVAGSSATYDIKLGAFSVGDISFVNAPYEMFCSNGQYIKDNTPFDMTFVTTLAFNSSCYVPDAATFAYDVTSYEERECYYEEGSGEILAEGFVELLGELHAKYTEQ